MVVRTNLAVHTKDYKHKTVPAALMTVGFLMYLFVLCMCACVCACVCDVYSCLIR